MKAHDQTCSCCPSPRNQSLGLAHEFGIVNKKSPIGEPRNPGESFWQSKTTKPARGRGHEDLLLLVCRSGRQSLYVSAPHGSADLVAKRPDPLGRELDEGEIGRAHV